MSSFKRTRKKADGTVVTDATYSIKFNWQGTQILLQSGQTDKAKADKIEREMKAELRAGRIPNLLNQIKQRQSLTITSLIAEYRAARCPDRNLQPRVEDSLERESRNLDVLVGFWGSHHPEHITLQHRDQYHAWRLERVTKGTGHRTVDIELCTLNNLLYWAARQGKIAEYKPLKGPSFQIAKNIRHCRELKPASADELHLIGAKLFADPNSEVLGWQFFLEAYTGLRSEEATQYLRWDAQRVGDQYQPGFIDDKYLYIQRCKCGFNPHIVLDDPTRPHLRELLTEMRKWSLARYPQSPWFLTGYRSRGERPVEKEVLTKRLEEICLELKIPKRTSHGLRAYYVTTRRGQGIDDGQIAYELGQGSGPDLIRSTYGDPPLNWRSLTNVFTWLPQNKDIPVAWRKWQSENIVLMPAAQVA